MSGAARKILVPVDGSIGSMHAAQFAGEYALAVGATVLLLHVHDPPTAELMGLASLERDQVKARIHDIAAARFRHAREALGPRAGELSIIELAELGDAADEIIGSAKAHMADLIVMGSRGLGPLDTLMLGSVSEKVVRRAHCPVTVVR